MISSKLESLTLQHMCVNVLGTVQISWLNYYLHGNCHITLVEAFKKTEDCHKIVNITETLLENT